jgi:hypothetical protein
MFSQERRKLRVDIQFRGQAGPKRSAFLRNATDPTRSESTRKATLLSCILMYSRIQIV